MVLSRVQDYLAWAFEYIHQCQQSKRKIVIIKIDFEKAFNSIEHGAILDIMRHMGFPAKWLNWVEMIFSSASSDVLLNGVPSNGFKCKLGVRQGDPLSPLIFVLGAELLQAILNEACRLGVITKPIRPDDESDFPVIQYADDTIILLKADQKEFFCVKALLKTFAQSTRLKINFHKSNVYPLNVAEDKIELLSSLLGCKVGTLPFTYLGLLMGTTRPKVIDFAPLVDRIERRLTSSATFLHYERRLILINSVLSTIPTYFMCSLQLPKTVILAIDSARRNYLWRGYDISYKRKHFAAWNRVLLREDPRWRGVARPPFREFDRGLRLASWKTRVRP